MCADTLSAPEDLSSASDEEIVARVCAGNPGLFEIIMRRYSRRVYCTVRAVAGDDGEAEDVMQAAYVSAYRQLGHFAGQTPFAIWLTRIALHEALARRRRDGRFVAQAVGGSVARTVGRNRRPIVSSADHRRGQKPATGRRELRPRPKNRQRGDGH
jgi:DNA-directed RNA polymerase specialized sigma24 family protein